jgi:hypothetical protein
LFILSWKQETTKKKWQGVKAADFKYARVDRGFICECFPGILKTLFDYLSLNFFY